MVAVCAEVRLLILRNVAGKRSRKVSGSDRGVYQANATTRVSMRSVSSALVSPFTEKKIINCINFLIHNLPLLFNE